MKLIGRLLFVFGVLPLMALLFVVGGVARVLADLFELLVDWADRCEE